MLRAMRRLTIQFSVSCLVALAFNPIRADAADTLVFNNSTGSFGGWNQGVNDIFMNRITAPAGSVITTIKSGWSSGITTQAPTTSVYIFSDVSNAPSSVAATFSYSSNDGTNWATFTGSYTVPAGGSFWIGQRSSIFINNSGGSNANQISSGWSISYTTRYYGTSLSGPFTNQGAASSPLWQIYTGASITPVAAPAAPVLSGTSNTITARETDTTLNAISYLVKLFAANGSTLLDSKTATNSSITNGITFSGLTPNTVYKIGVIAFGDQVTYSDSAISNLSTFTTPAASTITMLNITGNPLTLTYRNVYQLRASVTGTTGYVAFKMNGKRIPLCNRNPVISTVATCSFKPSIRGALTVTADFSSTDLGYESSQSPPFTVKVVTRRSLR